MRLKGKVAVVTGSTAGIGRATAELFAEEGAKVVVSGRRAELGEEAASGIRARGGTAAFCAADVTRAADLRGLVDFAVSTYGRLDILMNNAWSGRTASVTDLEEAEWDSAFAVSVRAAALASRYAVPEMIKAGGGSIIHVASVHGVRAARDNASYNALKAALINLAREMAMDYGKHNIRVNALCPGRIVTEGKV
jgi:NAD(P)-dependent dehydrogenase (short-subunit alcohol dehydrogenase family)